VGESSFSWSRPALLLAGLLTAYYAFPDDWDGEPVAVALGLAAVAAGLALLATMMVKELVSVHRGDPGRGMRVLAMLLVLLIMASSLTFFLIEEANPEQFDGLQTRTDALYFTLATMSTVGFGDVHAKGQLARVLVCLLIVFDVAVVASLVRAYSFKSGQQQD
jgi:formate-dependent nitrite reductase membrane component NrfD